MCDICTSAEEIYLLSARKMRSAVKAGFDPFASNLVNQSTIDQWSRGLYREIYGASGLESEKDFGPAYRVALENWKNDLVATESSSWMFCGKCATIVDKFVPKWWRFWK